MRHFLLVFIILLFTPSFGRAKVFDYNKVALATYLRGGMGLNSLQKTVYQPGFPTSMTFDDSGGVNQTYSAEFGFLYMTGRVCTRLGLELLYPQLTSGLAGKNAAGTPLVSLTSQIYSLVPKIDLEYSMFKNSGSRIYFGGGVGYAITTIKNSVNLTAAGNAQFPGVADYVEEGTGYGILGEGFFGLEWSFFDNVGFSLDVGYRYLMNSSFNSNRNTVTVLRTETLGSTIVNVDGTSRTANLSGPYASGTFRIYFR